MRPSFPSLVVASGIFFTSVFFTSCTSGNEKTKTPCELAAENDTTKNIKIDRTTVKSERTGVNEVIIRLNTEPSKLNPITTVDANSQYVHGRIFLQLLDIDPDSFTLFPELAKSRPEIKMIEDGEYKGGLSLTWEIRPEATWDNGSPITADDVAFTFKALKNPQVDAEEQRPSLDFLDDIVIDPTNNRKFTYYCKGHYFLTEATAGAYPVLPEYVYDPQKLMRKFTVKELNNPEKAAALKSNPDIVRFAKEFNSDKYSREKGFVVGCGPYEFDEWVTGQRIILKRKKDWWGDKLKEIYPGFVARPEKITYEIITDQNAAVAALKGEKIDVLTNLSAKDFLGLSADKRMLEKYNFVKPEQLAYIYLGLNMRSPKLSDVKVRRALAYCMDVDKILEKISYCMGTRAYGPVSQNKPYFNKDLKLIPCDIAQASKLLDEAGWKDSDGDGIRDKVVNGQKTKLSLELKYPGGSETTEKMMSLFAENCKKAGVEVTLSAREYTVFSEELKQHNFEIYYLSWSFTPLPEDPKQIWGTESYNGGSNYVGFGDQKSDEVIEKIRNEVDETKRNALYREFQQMVFDAQPYIFMYSPLNRMAIHARFNHTDISLVRPGYQANEFELDRAFGSKSSAAPAQ